MIGIALALPLAVGCALWIAEYGRPSWLARAVESSIEIVAGTPDIVIALFGLAIFQLGMFAPLSFRSQGGGVYGRSFIVAGAMMSLIAAPAALRGHAGMGCRRSRRTCARRRSRWARRASRRSGACCCPRVRSNIATGVTLGVSRIIGDTAIVLLLLGETLRFDTQGSFPG